MIDKAAVITKQVKPKPPLHGFAIAASVLLLGIMLIYVPRDFNLIGLSSIAFNSLGFVFISLSLGGSCTELSKLIKGENPVEQKPKNYWIGEGFGWMAPAIFLLVLAVAIHLSVVNGTDASGWSVIGKAAR